MIAYRARNVPNDNLDLQVPIWVSGARFVPTEPHLLALSTGCTALALFGIAFCLGACLSERALRAREQAERRWSAGLAGPSRA